VVAGDGSNDVPCGGSDGRVRARDPVAQAPRGDVVAGHHSHNFIQTRRDRADQRKEPVMLLFPQHLTVQPWQQALERHDGAPTVVLAPGRHRKRRRATYQVLDVRQQLFTLAPQEVLTADGVTVKVTAALRWGIEDPVRYVETVADPLARVYLAVQIALREGLAPLETEAVVRTARQSVTDSATSTAIEAGRAVGIEVLEVVVKDVILPADLRAAYGAVVTARQRAKAQLEAARAETAALRSLANGAKLLDDHPALAQLRIIQSLPIGSTIELTLPARD
jgi:regulator of protease activity HflC (stomatin/prohibitin superfamily)